MRLYFRLGEARHAVDLAREADGRWRVETGDVRLAGTVDGATPGEVRLEIDGRVVRAVVARDGGRWWVAVGGEIAVLEEAEEADAPGSRAHTAGEVVAPIPGRVVRVLAAEGEPVEAGQVLVTVEAMKTENAVRAEGAGRVARVLVAPGDRVEPGQPLMALDPGEPAGPDGT
ncbi:MAG TPA: biotin/lipoyl-containing protein [Thermodesulfobacteriota bacterium]